MRHALQLLSVAALGIYAGAMLTEGAVLVPYWRWLQPGEFLAWYADNDRRLVAFFGPLTVVTVLLAIASAAACVLTGHPGRGGASLAAVLTLAAFATYFLYFQGTNAGFASANIPIDQVGGELRRWAAWHWGRTGLSLAALAAAVLALRWRAL